MTTTNDWPGKPGVPLNPEKDGWHFLRMNNGTLKVSLWRVDGYWLNPPGCEGLTSPKTTAYWNTYLGPCLTSDEATALQARVAELEGVLGRWLEADDEGDGHECIHAVAAARAALERKEQKPEWVCPNNTPGCVKNCGNYGCGN